LLACECIALLFDSGLFAFLFSFLPAAAVRLIGRCASRHLGGFFVIKALAAIASLDVTAAFGVRLARVIGAEIRDCR
jgi:uncharacterized membrane protein YjjP (DUF1212 family)